MAEKKNFDSEFCGSLPLHHINSIQDYGYLLVLDHNLMIVQGSENLVELLNKDIESIINTSFADYISNKDLNTFKEVIAKDIKNRIPLNFTLKSSAFEGNCHVLMHVKAEYLVLELEKADQNFRRDFTAVFQDIKYISAAIEQADTVLQVCEVAVHELRKLSGFDGVLMYRFDEDWNGTVIAEEKDQRLEPYIGQTFPASDVPKQARALYLKNPYRLIPNRQYKPGRLYPVINPITNAFTDLSDCNLRGVAAVHLEYMKNMNINASMSIRVIYNESLWGLISCHHLEQRYLNYELCSVFEWLSEVISNRVSMLLNKEENKFSEALHSARAQITERIYKEESIMRGLLTDEVSDILNIFNASGVVVTVNGKMEAKGKVPKKDDLDNLLFWLEGKSANQVFSTSHISDLYEDAATFSDLVSGVLLIPIDSHKGEFVVCFRPEVVEDIHWGGDPNHAVNFDKDGKTYHPRNSFKLWKQTVHRHALPWKKQELEIAEALRNFLFEFRTKQLQN